MADETHIVGLKVGVDTGTSTAEVSKLTTAVDKLLSGLTGLEMGTNRATKELGNFRGSIEGIQSIIAGVGIVYFIKQVTQAANELDRANVGLAVTARYAGAGMAEAQAAAQSLAKDGLMSVSDASRSLQNLLSRGFSLDEAIKMMERFKDSAAFNRQASLEFGESIKGATEGLKNENSVLVDNAGVTKNVSIMWKEYAAQIGTTADKLTQAQKRQAEYNGIMQETEGQVGNAALMVNTFAGAQAKANQQTTELKQTLGVALQPALQGVLTILTPVVGGLRDMVYWVETLGARAGATWDKLKLRAEIALSGKGMFSKEGLEEYDKRVKEINSNLDATITEIVTRSMGPTLPNIGKDSGKRRKDVVIPMKPEKDTDSEDQLWKAYLTGLYGFNNELDRINPTTTDFQKSLLAVDDALAKQLETFKGYENNPGVQAYVESLKRAASGVKEQLTINEGLKNGGSQGRDLTMREQSQFDKSAMQNKWEVANFNYLQQEEQAQFDHNNMLLSMQHDLDQALMAEDARRTQNYEEQLIDQFEFEQQQADLQLQWTLDHTALTEDQVERLRAQYRAKRTAAEFKLNQDLAKNEQNTWQQKLGWASMGTNAMMDLTNSLVKLTDGKSKEMLILQKGAAMANAVVNTALGVTKVLAQVPYPYDLVMAGVVAAAGAAQIATIASSEIGGSAATSTTSLSGAGGGTVGSPVVTQPALPQTQERGTVTIVVQGNIIGEDDWVQNNLIPAIDRAGTRNVTITRAE